MKHSKLLFLPLAILLTSCVNISSRAEGQIFVPSMETSELPSFIDYYPGNGQPIVKDEANRKNISFRNDIIGTEAKFDFENKEDLVAITDGDPGLVLDYPNIANVYYGNYGLKLDVMPRRGNYLTFKLSKQVRYLEILCSPSFTNTFNHELGYNEFVSNETAITVDFEKYVKVLPNYDAETKKAKECVITFDLGALTDQFTISSAKYSATIYEINLY